MEHNDPMNKPEDKAEGTNGHKGASLPDGLDPSLPHYEFSDLAKGCSEVQILLGSIYRLKKTKSGKLILQK